MIEELGTNTVSERDSSRPPSESDLLRANEWVFDEFAKNSAVMLRNFIALNVPESAVEDVLQETLIGVWKYLRSTPAEQLKKLAYTIAKRKCYSHLRKGYLKNGTKIVFESIEDSLEAIENTAVEEFIVNFATRRDFEVYLCLLAEALDEIISKARGLKKVAGQTARSAGYPNETTLWPLEFASIATIRESIQKEDGKPLPNPYSVKSGLQQIWSDALDRVREGLKKNEHYHD